MDIITIKDQSELKKYLKEGSDCVYEFKLLGIYVNVKFKCNIFDTRNKRIHEGGKDGGMVVFKARSVKGNNIVVDSLEVDKIKAKSILSTYIFADKIKADTIEAMNVEANKVKAKIINSLVIQAKKVKAEYIDICELRSCSKLKAKKVSLLSMNGGRIIADEVSFNNKKEDQCLPMTRRRLSKTFQEKPSQNENSKNLKSTSQTKIETIKNKK